ncbi:ferric iron ABC transporter [Halorhodospira halochloris]|uniref:Ferric iron ABC transporter n=1 Tax=Halorhodospira halochloris TaxID=1052 RepID=A0A110B5Y9_HALHR|nr:ABC transporter ATP-binding protein [Halorhodospira halochloris]MBK1652763.1 ABC transporter ATP-binding protein [Halorhodospira halochloris]BAU58885.1 ferric iron ABC transporter [Halorhodospira halochloris]
MSRVSTPLLELNDMRCCYGNFVAVEQLSFALEQGSIACLLGPSGCGKTTALRTIAGFETIAKGEIRLQGRVISSPNYTLPPEKRRMGMVFQDYALFPHLNIYDNVTFGLRRMSRDERRKRADELLELVDLRNLGDRYPHELSGGQQQRISLIRAVAPRPDLVLLDEPFSNLDVDLRERLGREFKDIFRNEGVTAILVTHDQSEAFAMADEIGVMCSGRLIQWDTPYNLYHKPANRFVADFVGYGSIVEGIVADSEKVKTELGTLCSNNGELPWPRGTNVEVLLRPDDVKMGQAPSGLHGRIVKKAFKGAETLYTLRTPSGHELVSLAPSTIDYEEGSDIGLTLDTNHLVAFQRNDMADPCSCKHQASLSPAHETLSQAAQG